MTARERLALLAGVVVLLDRGAEHLSDGIDRGGWWIPWEAFLAAGYVGLAFVLIGLWSRLRSGRQVAEPAQ